MQLYATALLYAIPGFAVLMAIEMIIAHFMDRKVFRSFDTISSLSSGLTNIIKDVLGLSIVIVSYGYMAEHLALTRLEPRLWVYVIAFVCIDFAGYWSHRFEHRFNILWNRHIVHHSSEEFNLACALRQNISVVFRIFFFLYLPMAVVGVPVEVVALVAPIHLFAQFWYHTRLIGKMGWLEHVIVTPSHHRVHHAINDLYLDRNFAPIFIFWDKLFGTFQVELDEEPPVYGVKRAVSTWNPIKINWQHAYQVAQDAWHASSWRDRLRVWWMPTGWRPQDVDKAYPVAYTEDPHRQVKFETRASRGVEVWSWFQLVLHILLAMHFFSAVGDFPLHQLMFFGVYIFFAVYAYTELMEGSWEALVAESLKALVGFFILYHFGSWYEVSAGWVTYAMSGYLVLSWMVTVGVYVFQRPVVVARG